MERMYLLLVISSALDAEHAKIVDAVRHHSDGNFVEVFKQAAVVRGHRAKDEPIPFSTAYLFTSETPPSRMGFPLLNGDRYLILPVAQTAHWHEGLSVAHAWLAQQETARRPT